MGKPGRYRWTPAKRAVLAHLEERENQTINEIALALDIPTDTVRYQLVRLGAEGFAARTRQAPQGWRAVRDAYSNPGGRAFLQHLPALWSITDEGQAAAIAEREERA